MEEPDKHSQGFLLSLYQYSNTPTLQYSKHRVREADAAYLELISCRKETE